MELLKSGSHAVTTPRRPRTPEDVSLAATSWGMTTNEQRRTCMTTRGVIQQRSRGHPHSRGNKVLSVEAQYKTVMGLSYRDPTGVKESYISRPRATANPNRAARTPWETSRSVDYDSIQRRPLDGVQGQGRPRPPPRPSLTQQTVTPRHRRAHRPHATIQLHPTPGYTGCRPQTAR